MLDVREIRHFHMCSGLGGGAKGFNLARAQVGPMVAKFRCIGGFDNDAAACRDFKHLTGVQPTQIDLFSYDQYTAYHGRLPPPGWREATPADVQRAAGYERPHVIFCSMPCKGFSGLLSERVSLSPRYQALNELALRGMLLCLEAWADDPAEFILFENVPRIASSRGRHLLDQIEQLLSHYGFASAETTHDCGEIGELAQSRKRFLLVARHVDKVPPYLFEPVKKSLRPVGDVLGRCPLPGDLRAGPMHRVPMLQWKTWLRLAFVEAGKDWRSLERLQVHNGYLRDFAVTRGYPGNYGVCTWNSPTGTVTGESLPTNGAFSVADPRFHQSAKWHDGQAYGVRTWNEPTTTIPGQTTPGQGPYCVADPRYDQTWANNQFKVVSPDTSSVPVPDPRPTRELPFRNVFRVVAWNEVSRAITGGGHPTSGGIAVADPRIPGSSATTTTKTPLGTTTDNVPPKQQHAPVPDPRPKLERQQGDAWFGAGHYGVVNWVQSTGAVTASGSYDNGPGSVADPRCTHAPTTPPNAQGSVQDLPNADDRLVCVIQAEDNTWHRPFTTFELAALQSLIEPEEQLELDGLSDTAWRERIGNAVPSHAAREIASVIGKTLLLAWSGETFVLGSTPIWVRPIAVALSVNQRRPS